MNDNSKKLIIQAIDVTISNIGAQILGSEGEDQKRYLRSLMQEYAALYVSVNDLEEK